MQIRLTTESVSSVRWTPKQHNTQVFTLLRRRPGVTQSQLESGNDMVQIIEATMIGDIGTKLQAMATIGSEKKDEKYQRMRTGR